MIAMPPIDPAAYGRKLAIVVPYRDRAAHLAAFVPHMRGYFTRDKLDRYIDWSIHVVEQAGTGLFNRGKLKNIGFDLVKDQADYVCFHDVDYLPVWADYSYPDKPTRIIWHGLRVTEEYDRFFGGALLFRTDDFRAINGYSNDYWGWGCEDVDIRLRCDFAGVGRAYRDGTFTGLPHPHIGLKQDGSFTPEAATNQALFTKKRPDLASTYLTDGLNNLAYSVKERGQLRHDGQGLPNAFRYLVEVGAP
jgi:hypothetical protein